MKKLLCLSLSIIMTLSLLPVSASAAVNATLSTQKLTVNGEAITCEKYGINGYNYFKLRDIAKLLNGTKSQFEVGWDNATQIISLTTGSAYTPVGGELTLRGDLSKQAKENHQTLLIDGEKVSNLSVYSIGGNNFFKLRDLGDALNFNVDYDAATNTAIVESADTVRAVSINEAYGLPKNFTPYAAPKTNQEYIQNLIYAFINGKWSFSETVPDGCEWVYPYYESLCKENNEIFGIFSNQRFVPYCKNGSFGIATYGETMTFSAKEITAQVQSAYAKASEISQKLHESGKITEKSTQAEIAKTYYDYLLQYGVAVGDGKGNAAASLSLDSAYSVLVSKKAACGGRAAAMSLLLRMEKVPSTCIFVKTMIGGKQDSGHVFTYAKLDGKLMGIDWGNKLGIFDFSTGKKSGNNATFVAAEEDFEHAEIALGMKKSTGPEATILRWEETSRNENGIIYKVWAEVNSLDKDKLYYLCYGAENNCIKGSPSMWGNRFASGKAERAISLQQIQEHNMPECFFLMECEETNTQ